jgi:hypothetical protein
MRNYYRFCLVRNCLFDPIGLDIVCSQLNIQKYRDQIILEIVGRDEALPA